MEVLSISCPEMRISLCLFVPETSFLQAVNLTVLLNMKHNLVKSYFCMVNYSISNKMHFAFIVSVLFLMFHICWISYLNAYHLWQWILSGSIWNYINTTSEIFGFSSPTLFRMYHVYVLMMMSGTFSSVYKLLLDGNSEELFWRHG